MEDNKTLTVSLQEFQDGHTKKPEVEFPDQPEQEVRKPQAKEPSQPPGPAKKSRKRGSVKRNPQKSGPKPVQKPEQKPKPKQDQSTAEGDPATRRKRSRPRRKPRKKTDNSSGNTEPRRGQIEQVLLYHHTHLLRQTTFPTSATPTRLWRAMSWRVTNAPEAMTSFS